MGKVIEITCRAGHIDSIVAGAQQSSGKLLSATTLDETGRGSVRVFVDEENLQKLLDRLQSQLPPEAEALILLQPVDAEIGRADIKADDKKATTATREELFAEISNGTEMDRDFLLLAALSTVVAAVGLAQDDVAVIIGAMVIAPLLGPNLGLALGAALGDRKLIVAAIWTNAVGMAITVGLAALLALVWSPNLESQELLARTEVRLSSVVLALAAGVAAVQSLTTRLANLLVGVMVAVALVPPATVFGMMLGIQQWHFAAGAGLLLAANVAAVNLSAQLVFLARGVRPRTWLAQREAVESTWISIAVWAILLAIIIVLVVSFAANAETASQAARLNTVSH